MSASCGELAKVNKSTYKVKIKGEVNPACRFILNEYMLKYDGDWNRVMKHLRVKRLAIR